MSFERRHEDSVYQTLIDQFVATGQVNGYTDNEDPLYNYLVDTMQQDDIKWRVLSSEVAAVVFKSQMIAFVQTVKAQEHFAMTRRQGLRLQMQQAREWSVLKRRDGWKALWKEMQTQGGEWGFNGDYFLHLFEDPQNVENDSLWLQMIDNWQMAEQIRAQAENRELLKESGEVNRRRLRNNLTQIPAYLQENHIDPHVFRQAWSMMNGMWNEVDFKRMQRVARLQQRYPQIAQMAQRMGRTMNPEGEERVHVAQGDRYKMPHATPSDIEGVSVGNDLNALLPMELALCTDRELSDLFNYKYLTRKLQTFQYRSNMLNPARKIESRPATTKGPMVVCIDTSGSMEGEPGRIAQSMVMRLVELADSRQRPLFLIAFSVSATPIDAHRERGRLMAFFNQMFTGDTNATRMLETTFALLEGRTEYQNADVLWITDFQIPMPATPLLAHLKALCQRGTRWYGLQIGCKPNEWRTWFDEIVQVPT